MIESGTRTPGLAGRTIGGGRAAQPTWRGRRTPLLLTLLLGLLLALSACGGKEERGAVGGAPPGEQPPAAAAGRPAGTAPSAGQAPAGGQVSPVVPAALTGRLSVILVTVDTLRADRLSCYGFRGGQTPYIDGVAASGVIFEDAVTPVPITLPSHAAIFTGRYPPAAGVRNNGTYRLGREAVTLAELFQKAGYRTAAFVGASVLDSAFGLDQGFDLYDDQMPGAGATTSPQRRADYVISAAVRWLAERDERPFFAWVHLWDPHHPYTPPEPMHTNFPNDPYFGEVSFVDAQLGLLFKSLEALGFMRENTLLALTADHGEGLGEHGEATHGVFLYESTVRVPLIVRMPGRLPGGQRLPGLARTIDIAPTIIELAGLERPSGVQGVSLVPRMTGGGGSATGGEVCYLESLYGEENYGWSPLFGLRSGSHKFIRAPEPELYSLASGREEKQNLVSAEPGTARDMDRQLGELMAGLVPGSPSPEGAWSPDAQLRAQLESLGYVQVGGGPQRRAEGAGADPKKMMPLESRREEGLTLVRQGKSAEGIRLLEDVARKEPRNPMVWENLAEAYMAANRPPELLSAVERGLALRPGNPNLNVLKGSALLLLGRDGEAERHFQELLKTHPDQAALQFNLGDTYQKLGRLPEALARYHEAEKLGFRNPLSPFNRGMILFQQGRHGEAVEAFKEATRWKPDFAEAWHNIGVNAARLGRAEEAREAYLKAIELDPRSPLYHTTYGYFLTQQRQLEEARRELEKALELDSRFAAAHNNLAWLYGTSLGAIQDGRKAVYHAEEAMRLAGDPPPENILNTYAEALRTANRIDEALQLNARLRAAHPDNPYYQTQQRRFEASRVPSPEELERARKSKGK